MYYLTQEQVSNTSQGIMPQGENSAYLEILYNISRELAGSLELHDVLSRVLILSTHNLGAERASLIALDDQHHPTDSVVLYHGEVGITDPQYITDLIQTGLAGWVMRNRQPALLANTHQDERWIDLTYDGRIIRDPKSALCVPVLHKERIIGMLTLVHPQVNYFTTDHLQLLQAIADIAGIAIYNARLYQDLEQNRNLYRGLFEGVADPILVTNLAGDIIEFNHQAREVTGYTRRDLLKMNLDSLEDRSARTISSLRNDKREFAVRQYESRLRTKDGQQLPVEIRVSLNKTFDQDTILWILHDISERQKLESLRDSMTAMIYHDLRSPLANIISSLELMEDGIPSGPSPQMKQLLQIATRSSAHMQRLISSLLDIKRLEAGQEITRKSEVKLEDLINQAVEISRPLIESKEIVLENLIPAKIPPLVVDEDMIRRVIINLLENAVKFSPMRSQISLGIRPDHEHVLVFVEDQGTGIPDGFREQIFDKFVRLEVDGRSRGLGLGLAFCRLAVQAHGGTIWVENNTPVGSRFMFKLPVTD